MGTLTATLQPDTGVVGHRTLGKFDLVVSANSQLALTLLSLDIPAVDGLGKLIVFRDRLGQHGPGTSEHVDMRPPLVTSGSDDEVGLEDLLLTGIGKSIQRAILDMLNLDLELVALVIDTGDLATGKNAVRPLSLVVADLALLVIHLLIKVLNELQANNAVVGGTSLGQKVLARPGSSGPHVVNVLGVEDGVDAMNIVRECLTYT